MAFTTDLDTDIGQVRFHLTDTVEGAGVLPQGGNLSDDQITYLLSLSTAGDTVMRAVAAGAAVVARAWANAVNTTAGPLKQELQQAYEHWAQQAKSLAGQYGSDDADAVLAEFTAFSVPGTRDDGYSECATGAEYAPCRRRWRPC